MEQNASSAMFVDLSSCIQCDRCVRACREEQANDVIGVFGRGAEAKIVFDTDVSMGKTPVLRVGSVFRLALLAP